LTSSSRSLDLVVLAHSEVCSTVNNQICRCDLPMLCTKLTAVLYSPGGSSRGRRQRRGEDVVHPLKVTLEELYNGTSKKLSLSRNVLCSKCNG
jgi:hypothetical protein